MGVLEKDGIFIKRSEGCSDGYVVDMENLVRAADKDSNGRTLQRTLSRKGSRRLLEWKGAKERDATDAAKGMLAAASGGEKSVVLQLVGTESNKSTAAENTCRKFLRGSSCVSRCSTSSWLDPRTVLFFFATLSSMGTIVLIYFTLSIANVDAGGTQGQ